MRSTHPRVRKVIICAAIGTCILFAFISFRKWSEPRYKGQRLGNWIESLRVYDTDYGFHPPASADAVKALRASGPAAIPYLVKWLSRPEPREDNGMRPLNKLTAFILIHIPLVERMLFPRHDPPIPSKDAVAWAFLVLGPEAKPAIPSLVKITDDTLHSMPASKQDVLPTNYESFHYALRSLAFVGADSVPALLMVATNFQGYHIQWEVIDDFREMGTNGAAAIPALIAWARDPDSWVRAAAVTSLGEIAQQPALVIPHLRAALKDSDWMVRRNAADALGGFGAEAAAAMPDLVVVMDDVNRQAQIEAARSIGIISAQAAIAMPPQARTLQAWDPRVRYEAAAALGNIGGRAAMDVLISMTNDPDEGVRERALDSLNHF
jgi:HEAT repeat protein